MLSKRMEKFLTFDLYVENKGFILTLFLINFIYFFLFTLFFFLLIPDLFKIHKYYLSINEIYTNFKINIFPKLIPISVTLLIEEIVFRGPISFMYKISRYQSLRIIFIYILISIFAFGHMDNYSIFDFIFSFPNVFVSGYLFSYIYLIAGGKDGNFVKPIVITFILHLIFDLFIFSVQGVPNWF